MDLSCDRERQNPPPRNTAGTFSLPVWLSNHSMQPEYVTGITYEMMLCSKGMMLHRKIQVLATSVVLQETILYWYFHCTFHSHFTAVIHFQSTIIIETIVTHFLSVWDKP